MIFFKKGGSQMFLLFSLLAILFILASMIMMEKLDLLDVYVYMVGSVLLLVAFGYLAVFNFQLFWLFVFVATIVFGFFTYLRETSY